MKPLYTNQMASYRFVTSMVSGIKYEPKGKWLSYNTLDYLLKASKDPSYYGMPSQSNQQTLKLLVRDYGSFFEALKAYQGSPVPNSDSISWRTACRIKSKGGSYLPQRR